MITTARECEILPTEYIPQSIDEFVGPARRVAQRLINSAKMCLKTGAPAAHLLVGPSGSGKTALARFALKEFGVQPWTLAEAFGSDLTVDRAREIAADMHGTNVFGGYRGFLLDECDRASKDGRDRALQFIGDHKQARNTVVVATSNLSIEEFDAMEKTPDAKGRFSSRFQVHVVTCPNSKEAAEIFSRWVPAKQAIALATTAATGEKGKISGVNMRAALRDLTSLLQNE